MICKWCNKEVIENAKFCTNCGGNLMDSNNKTLESSEINNATTNNINSTQTQANSNEGKVNVWLVVLSCLVPLAGLIIFLCNKDTNKKTAKASGIAALISFGLSIIISIIIILTTILSAGKLIGNAINTVGDNIEEQLEESDSNLFDSSIFEDLDNKINTAVSSEWQKYEFIVNDKTLKLPSTYNELSNATSSTIQSSYTKSYLQSGYYALLNMYKNDKLSLYIEVLNDTNLDQLYTDCKVTRISQTKYQSSVGADVITFPGNLKVGQEITKDEIVNILGNPSDVKNYTDEGYISDTYSYYEDTTYTTTNYYEIKVVNGIIDELTLDNRNYK